jgi:hypothetical protein
MLFLRFVCQVNVAFEIYASMYVSLCHCLCVFMCLFVLVVNVFMTPMLFVIVCIFAPIFSKRSMCFCIGFHFVNIMGFVIYYCVC